MASDRIVVGSTGDDARARSAARRLRDEGHEIVFVGGGQSPEQLARTAVAEDAVRIVADGDDDALLRLGVACSSLDASDIVIESLV